MKHLFQIIFLVLFLVVPGMLRSQNITGCWGGYISGEFLQVNVEQKGNELCGYTYDYELGNSYGYCIANFQGRYDDDKKIYFLNGTSFVENSGSHVLMRILLWRNERDTKNILRGKVYIQSSAVAIFGMGGDDVVLKKIAATPKIIAGKTAPCFPKPVKKIPKKTVPSKPVISKPAKPKVTIPKTPVADPVKKDTAKKTIPVAPVPIPKEPSQLERIMTSRKQSKQSRVTIDVNRINLKLYDNGTVDNDTVSVFYNGRLLLSHQRLSEKAIELTVQLDENASQHEITMFAENLGSIPPNTALIVVTAGSKRYELHSKASMEENAVLVFDYKPK